MTWWKILNIKSLFAGEHCREPLMAPISDPSDPRLQTILDFGKMILKMGGKKGIRVKQLTIHTAKNLYHTCCGLVDLCRHLLETSHRYVLFGKFSTDPLEKEFSKLRQGSGGAYFINVQNVIQKLHINQTKLIMLLENTAHEIISDIDDKHSCHLCDYHLEEDECKIFDDLEGLEDSISIVIKKTFVHVAGYVTRHDEKLTEDELLGKTTFYYQNLGQYSKSLDLGGLNVPSDVACQWTFFSFILFESVKEKVCRFSLINLLMYIAEFYSFDGISRKHCHILSNIFLKNYAIESTPSSGKERMLKAIKLT